MIQFNDTDKNLTLLMEECAEVIQICAKIKRFGIGDFNPSTGQINRKSLEQELGDVSAIIGILIENKTISPMELAKAELKKLHKLQTWYDPTKEFLDRKL